MTYNLTENLLKISKKYSEFTIDQIINDKIMDGDIELITATLSMLVATDILDFKDGKYTITSMGDSIIDYETVNGDPAVESANNAAPSAAPLNNGLPPNIPD